MLNKTTNLKSLALTIGLSAFAAFGAQAQCESWNGNPQMDALTDAHSVYRGFMKAKDYAGAYEAWKKVYEAAPAADGKRDYHYMDGVTIHKDMYEKETDAAKKEELMNKIMGLYDAAASCVEADKIKMSKRTKEEHLAYLHGQKGFDMFYTFNQQDKPTYDECIQSIKGGGNKTLYSIITPLAVATVRAVSAEAISKADARDAYKMIQDVCNHNIANNAKYGTYYQQSLDYANAQFDAVSTFIFDCDYFVAKLKPEFEGGKQDDPAFLEESIRTLKRQGCTEEEPFLVELEAKWAVYAAEINAKRQAEFEANNPAVMAKKMYDAGDFDGAIAKYNEAITKDVDPEKQAGHYMKIASIQFRKQKKYSAARSAALKAANLKSGWGKPYMLIGDMYASSSRNCGKDDFSKRLAILAAINKYSHARSIDPSVADDANKRIGKYSSSKPKKEDAFMQGYKEGQSVKVGCWIGENVKLSF